MGFCYSAITLFCYCAILLLRYCAKLLLCFCATLYGAVTKHVMMMHLNSNLNLHLHLNLNLKLHLTCPRLKRVHRQSQPFKGIHSAPHTPTPPHPTPTLDACLWNPHVLFGLYAVPLYQAWFRWRRVAGLLSLQLGAWHLKSMVMMIHLQVPRSLQRR